MNAQEIYQKRIEEKSKELAQKYFPNKMNIWARENVEASYVAAACVEMANWILSNQWISVEEEYPIGTCVLLDKYGNMQLDKFDFRAWGYIQNKGITHWIKIPKLNG